MNSRWVKLTTLTLVAAALTLTAPAIDNTRPDITVAPCAWFTSNHPIPADTATNVCVTPDGTLHKWTDRIERDKIIEVR